MVQSFLSHKVTKSTDTGTVIENLLNNTDSHNLVAINFYLERLLKVQLFLDNFNKEQYNQTNY